MKSEFKDVFEKFENQNNLYRNEGSVGVKNLCKIVRALGYKDPFDNCRLDHESSLGDLMVFLEDNPGAIQAIKEWICDSGIEEWKEAINSELNEEENDNE